MRHKVILPPPRRKGKMPVKIAPVPPVPSRPSSKGGFFHGLHIVWVVIIGLLVWQNMSQANDIDKMKQQLENHRNAILETAKWADEADNYLHSHPR